MCASNFCLFVVHKCVHIKLVLLNNYRKCINIS